MTEGLWYQNAIFYELSTRSFYDSNDDGIGDLRGLIQKLDYLKELGIDCIWLLPIFPSPLLDDGYDISDYYNIHPELGTLEDFKDLIRETHQRGMRIITDLVLNHTSDQCAWFKEAEQDETSPFHDYYVWSETDQKYKETRIIFLDVEESNWTWNENAKKYYWHRFYSSQPDLNYDNPAVREEMKNIMRFWLDLGIDGFRADAVPYLFQREGTNCENLPETHAYLKELRQLIDEEYPGRILLAEANQWPQDLRPYFADGDEFQMAFHFPLMPRLFKALAKQNISSIVEILDQTPQIPDNCEWCTFLRNHDELTLEMVSEEDRQFLWDHYAPIPRMRLNMGIRRRLSPLLSGNQKMVELLYAILFALPGAPILYYGDEIGMGDNIYLSDRDGVRTPMQWDATRNAGFSRADEEQLHLPVIKSDLYNFKDFNVSSQSTNPESLLNILKKMIKIWKENSVLSRGECTFIPHENLPALLHIVLDGDDEKIIALNNLSDDQIEIGLSDFVDQDEMLYNLFEGEMIKPDQTCTLKAYQYCWLKVVKL